MMLEYGCRGGNLGGRGVWGGGLEEVGGKKVVKESIVREVGKEIRKYRR